jgi:hypothetical protein
VSALVMVRVYVCRVIGKWHPIENNFGFVSAADEETRYHLSQLYSHEAAEVKFPLTNGSLFAHLMNPPSADGARGNLILINAVLFATHSASRLPPSPPAATASIGLCPANPLFISHLP